MISKAWTPATEGNSSAVLHVSPRCFRRRSYLRKAQRCEGVSVCRAECVFWGMRGSQTPTLSGHSPSSHSHQRKMLDMPGEKTTASSARGGTAVSGWKRATTVVFWWSPRPQRNAPSLVLQSRVGNINTGLPEEKTHTRQHVNHDVIPDILLPDCPRCPPTLYAACLSALSRLEQ